MPMHREVLTMVCTSDLAGQLRGKGFPARDLKARLIQGVGWAPTNLMITAFGPIADSPWGALEDRILVPDPDTEVNVDFGDDSPPERFLIGDLRNLDGKPWSCCPREFLRRGLNALEQEANLRLYGAFEHEFIYTGVDPKPHSSYNLDAVRRQGIFAEVLLRSLRSAGVEPETFMAEYAPCQYEVSCAATTGLRIADRAVITREIVRGTAHRLGHRATFSPVVEYDGVGNGVHIHFSLQSRNGEPVTHDPSQPGELSLLAGQFVAGICKYMPALCALTAPSMVSYLRLVPHRWSAAFNNLGLQDREAGVRICPVLTVPGMPPKAKQFHLEYRAADAAASPYMALGALVHAGLAGIREKLPTPAVTQEDLAELDDDALQERGLVRLPEFLEDALQALERTQVTEQWLGKELLQAYLRHKHTEIAILKHLEPEQQCLRYQEVY